MQLKTWLCGLVLLVSMGGAAGRAQTLRQTADRIGLLVGTAVNPTLFSHSAYAATLGREFNMIEPENVMKWATIEPARGVFRFAPGDEVVAFAEAHGMKVRGHNLLWGIYNPAWVSRGNFTPNDLRQIMRNHILTEVRHYKGKVFAWDVVNEAFDQNGGLKHSIWYDRPGIGLAQQGTEYIAQAFRWAHEADPAALLFYNDYAAEGLNAKSDAIYGMVKDFRQRGVPIDGVGLQMHLHGPGQAPASLEKNIRRLAKLRVQVHITEMDVALPIAARGEAANQEDLDRQAATYKRVAAICAREPACTAFQTWGFTDKHSWIPGSTHGKKGAALIFDANYHPKPAFRAILSAFEEETRAHPRIRQRRLKFEQSSRQDAR
ncbi:MAG: endo-1,4-beta-xylanase [Terriglobia bacterium]